MQKKFVSSLFDWSVTKTRKKIILYASCIVVILISICGCKEKNPKEASPIFNQPLTVPLPAKAGKQTVTANWLLNLPWDNENPPFSAIKWQDDTHIMYTIPPTFDHLAGRVETVNVETGKRTLLSPKDVPAVSPNGQWVVLTRSVHGEKQLWLMKKDGSQARQLTHFSKEQLRYRYEFSWSPDSRHLALYYQQYDYKLAFTKKSKPLARAASETSAVDANHLQPEWPPSIIEVIDILSGQSQQILSVDAQVYSLSWFPDGEALLFVKQRTRGLYNETHSHSCIQSIRLKDHKICTLVAIDGLQQGLAPKVSPDGQQVSFLYDAENSFFGCMRSLGLVSTRSTQCNAPPPIKRLTHELKLLSQQWSPDGSKIYVQRDCGAYKQIYAVDVSTGVVKQITHAPLNVHSCAFSPNGQQLAWVGEDAHATRIVRIAKPDGSDARDIVVMPGVPKDMALSEVREIDWVVPNYPARMRGLLLLPLNYHEGTRYPLIVDIHGGGEGASIFLLGGILTSTPLEWQMWTAKGYAVFVPEFRSSAAFGSLAIVRDLRKNHDLIQQDMNDVLAGVDALIDQGIVDDKRMIALGLSAGARRANWLTVSTHRFRAIISKEGWADEWLKAGIASLPGYYNSSPALEPETYQKNSALFHARGATTPTLFLMGNPDLGGADPYDTVLWLFNALKAQGIETQYIRYPDEGHMFERSANRRDALERIVKWADQHSN